MSTTTQGLEERRQQRLAKRKQAHLKQRLDGWRAATERAKAEKAFILADLKELPLRKLRAIHKAARQAFAK